MECQLLALLRQNFIGFAEYRKMIIICFFDHTLEDFIKEWKDKFLFYPPLDRESPFISGTIYVTEYETF